MAIRTSCRNHAIAGDGETIISKDEVNAALNGMVKPTECGRSCSHEAFASAIATGTDIFQVGHQCRVCSRLSSTVEVPNKHDWDVWPSSKGRDLLQQQLSAALPGLLPLMVKVGVDKAELAAIGIHSKSGGAADAITWTLRV